MRQSKITLKMSPALYQEEEEEEEEEDIGNGYWEMKADIYWCRFKTK